MYDFYTIINDFAVIHFAGLCSKTSHFILLKTQ